MRLNISFLPPEDVIKGFYAYWWPLLKYPTPISNLPMGHNVLQKLYFHLLPKLGVNRHFPSVMTTAPTFLGGLGLPNFEWEQAIQHINVFSIFYRSTCNLGKLLSMSLEYCQLHIGSTQCFLNLPYLKHHFLLPSTWVHIIWEFLSTFQLQIHLDRFPVPQPHRELDISIMDAIRETSFFSTAELLHISKFRLYLQVYFLSDLVIGDCNRVHPSYLHGEQNICCKSSFHWPKHVPSTYQRQLWITAISMITDSHACLKRNLGNIIRQ